MNIRTGGLGAPATSFLYYMGIFWQLQYYNWAIVCLKFVV